MTRCAWVNEKDPLSTRYHDSEWGVPQHDDRKLFELLLLESFQAGLSWACVLHKRENLRRALDGFDPVAISHYGEDDLARLMNNAGIIRNRRKLCAAVANSRVFLDIVCEFGTFDAYLWKFTQGETLVEPYTLRSASPLSERVSRDLYRCGMRFVGPTIVHSYLQAAGVLCAHGCECSLCRVERA